MPKNDLWLIMLRVGALITNFVCWCNDVMHQIQIADYYAPFWCINSDILVTIADFMQSAQLLRPPLLNFCNQLHSSGLHCWIYAMGALIQTAIAEFMQSASLFRPPLQNNYNEHSNSCLHCRFYAISSPIQTAIAVFLQSAS